MQLFRQSVANQAQWRAARDAAAQAAAPAQQPWTWRNWLLGPQGDAEQDAQNTPANGLPSWMDWLQQTPDSHESATANEPPPTPTPQPEPAPQPTPLAAGDPPAAPASPATPATPTDPPAAAGAGQTDGSPSAGGVDPKAAAAMETFWQEKFRSPDALLLTQKQIAAHLIQLNQFVDTSTGALVARDAGVLYQHSEGAHQDSGYRFRQVTSPDGTPTIQPEVFGSEGNAAFARDFPAWYRDATSSKSVVQVPTVPTWQIEPGAHGVSPHDFSQVPTTALGDVTPPLQAGPPVTVGDGAVSGQGGQPFAVAGQGRRGQLRGADVSQEQQAASTGQVDSSTASTQPAPQDQANGANAPGTQQNSAGTGTAQGTGYGAPMPVGTLATNAPGTSEQSAPSAQQAQRDAITRILADPNNPDVARAMNGTMTPDQIAAMLGIAPKNAQITAAPHSSFMPFGARTGVPFGDFADTVRQGITLARAGYAPNTDGIERYVRPFLGDIGTTFNQYVTALPNYVQGAVASGMAREAASGDDQRNASGNPWLNALHEIGYLVQNDDPRAAMNAARDADGARRIGDQVPELSENTVAGTLYNGGGAPAPIRPTFSSGPTRR